MSCSECSSGGSSPKGCKSNGGCSTGGCNKMNTFDWLSEMDLHDPTEFRMVEVSFKSGARKEFFKNENFIGNTGDYVVVDADPGFGIGKISLSGELVRAQMKKKKVHDDKEFLSLIRVANDRDMEKLHEARSLEKNAMIKARAISRSLGIEMKVGDVEYQGDKRKATFYYTADGRIDFRELVRAYAREFKVKIEMRQIGSRQESARIGGIGSCGRELCCSTWFSDFKSVSTTAARYQNIAINQVKLSGQCGRLKCCLNFELDTYVSELATFPKNVEILKTKKGKAVLIKKDIFKGLLFYGYDEPGKRGQLVAVDKERAREIKILNKKGEVPNELLSEDYKEQLALQEDQEIEFADVTGQIELPSVKKRKSRNRNKNKRNKTDKQIKGKASKQGDQSNENAKPKEKSNSPRGKGNNAGSRKKHTNKNTPSNQKSEGQKPAEGKSSEENNSNVNKNKKRRNWRNKKKNSPSNDKKEN